MIKLYPTTLHNATLTFRKRSLQMGLLLLIMLHSGIFLYSQCMPPPAPVVTPNPVFMCVNDPPVKIKVTAMPVTSTFCSGVVNIPVPDNNPAGSSHSVNVSIPPTCPITDVRVSINMQHTRIGDMVFVLKAPNGQVLNLDYNLSATGGSGTTTGFLNTVISSLGIVPLSTGTNPYTGTFKADAQSGPAAGPTGMLPTTTNWASLLSVPNGTWTLGFYDAVTSQTGTLNSWCLSFGYSCGPGTVNTQATWTPFAGLFYDPAATAPYTGLPVDSVWARPMPAGTYTYQVTTQSLPAGSPGWSFSNTAPVSIPIGGAAALYPSNVVVAGLPISGFRVKSVVLNNLSHSKPEDLDIVLLSPSGQAVLLMSDAGGTSPVNNVTYTFADPGQVMTMGANGSGIYRPTNYGVPDIFPPPGPNITQVSPSLALFGSNNMNGTWSLFVADDDGTAGLGSIAGGYTINFDTASLPCMSPPTTVIVNVGVPSTITAQPVDQYVCLGNNAQFTVAVTNGLTYNWQQSSDGGTSWANLANAFPYSGINTASLTITTPSQAMNGYRYRVIINGGVGCGGAISNTAILFVNPLPTVTIWASPYIEILPTMTTTLFSSVSPNPAATYTWYHNGVVVPAANADTLLVDYNGLGEYQLGVTDIKGCSSLSNIVEIKDSTGRMFVYPNPSAGRFQVRIHTERNTPVSMTIAVYNNSGIRVLTRSFTQTTPYEKIEVDVRRYGKGLFWVELLDSKNKRISMNRVMIH